MGETLTWFLTPANYTAAMTFLAITGLLLLYWYVISDAKWRRAFLCTLVITVFAACVLTVMFLLW